MTCAESLPDNVVVSCSSSSSTFSSEASPKSVVDIASAVGAGGSVFDSPSSIPRTCVQSELQRIKELEHKRLALRHQRFSLEQKLYEFCGKHRDGDESSVVEGSNLTTIDSCGGTAMNTASSTSRKCSSRRGIRPQPQQKQNKPKHVLDLPWKEEASGVRVIYSGPINDRGEPHGSDGILKFSDGQVYRGDICNGIRSGKLAVCALAFFSLAWYIDVVRPALVSNIRCYCFIVAL